MTHSFHPEAFEEFEASALFYLREVSEATGLAFVSVVEAGIEEIVEAPERWRMVAFPGIRRYVCSRFPFVLYYRLEPAGVVIYAVMHASRRPGYWAERLE